MIHRTLGRSNPEGIGRHNSCPLRIRTAADSLFDIRYVHHFLNAKKALFEDREKRFFSDFFERNKKLSLLTKYECLTPKYRILMSHLWNGFFCIKQISDIVYIPNIKQWPTVIEANFHVHSANLGNFHNLVGKGLNFHPRCNSVVFCLTFPEISVGVV